MMIVLFVLLGVFLLLFLLLLAYLRIGISYKDQSFCLYVQVGPILYKVPLQKMPRYRSLAKQLRGKKLSGQAEASKKKQVKKEKKAALNELRGDLSLPEFLSALKDISIRMAKRYSKKLHITVEELYITVGTGDPATTGIAYGAVVQSTAYLLEFLDCTVTLTPLPKDTVRINADFAGGWDAYIQVNLKIRIIHLLKVLFYTFFQLKSSMNTNEQPNMKI